MSSSWIFIHSFILQIHDVPCEPRGAGHCASANWDIERGEIVVEYQGKHVSLVEAAIRKENYTWWSLKVEDAKLCKYLVWLEIFKRHFINRAISQTFVTLKLMVTWKMKWVWSTCLYKSRLNLQPWLKFKYTWFDNAYYLFPILFLGLIPTKATKKPGQLGGALINPSWNRTNLRPSVALKNLGRARMFLVALHDIPETVEFLWNYNDTDWECHADSQTIPSQAL